MMNWRNKKTLLDTLFWVLAVFTSVSYVWTAYSIVHWIIG